LLRWQELAEINEKKSEELQIELDKAKRKISENNDIVAMLREQRKQLEKEWGQAQMRADELEKKLEETESSDSLLAKSDETIKSLVSQQVELKAKAAAVELELNKKLEQLNKQLLLKEEEVTDARLHYKKLHIRWKKANAELDAIQQKPTQLLSSDQLDELNKKLLQSEEHAEQLQEQMVWNQANLETAQRELTQIRTGLAERDQQIQSLQQEVGIQKEQIAKQIADSQALQKSLQTQEIQAKQNKKELKETLRIQRSQLEASEKELAYYLNETSNQGARLAEFQAMLVERDIQLQEAKQTIAKQQKFINHMQQVTKKRLRDLQEQLVAAQKA
jgi:chromosome segregation ATPase